MIKKFLLLFVLSTILNVANQLQAEISLFPDQDFETKKFGYVDSQGSIIIDHEFFWAHSFNETGHATVIADRMFSTIGIINKLGEFVVEPGKLSTCALNKEYPEYFPESNLKNIPRLCDRFFNLRSKSLGHYTKVRSTEIMLLDSDNDLVKKLDVFNATPFYNQDVAIVQIGKNKFRLVDELGDFKGEKVFLQHNGYHFKNPFGANATVAVQSENKQWGYLGFDGEWVIEPIFRQAFPFTSSNLALVVNDKGERVLIDSKGHTVKSSTLRSVSNIGIEKAYYSTTEVAPDGSILSGLVDADLNVVIPAWFRTAEPISNDVFSLSARISTKDKPIVKTLYVNEKLQPLNMSMEIFETYFGNMKNCIEQSSKLCAFSKKE